MFREPSCSTQTDRQADEWTNKMKLIAASGNLRTRPRNEWIHLHSNSITTCLVHQGSQHVCFNDWNKEQASAQLTPLHFITLITGKDNKPRSFSIWTFIWIPLTSSCSKIPSTANSATPSTYVFPLMRPAKLHIHIKTDQSVVLPIEVFTFLSPKDRTKILGWKIAGISRSSFSDSLLTRDILTS